MAKPQTPESATPDSETPEAAAGKTSAAFTKPFDPVDAIIAGLAGKDEKARRAAREQFSAIAGAGRPWEQLPPMLKSAARFDLKALCAADADPVVAGYSQAAASKLKRDLGLG